ncbi:MAG: hypothetical protein ACKO04_11485 [Actinomycetes bacterium]
MGSSASGTVVVVVVVDEVPVVDVVLDVVGVVGEVAQASTTRLVAPSSPAAPVHRMTRRRLTGSSSPLPMVPPCPRSFPQTASDLTLLVPRTRGEW